MSYDATVCSFRCTICRFRCHFVERLAGRKNGEGLEKPGKSLDSLALLEK